MIRRRRPLLRTLLVLIGLLIVSTTGILVLWRLDRVVLAPGAMTGGSVSVCAPREALIARVPVRSGRTVKSGDLLVELDTRDLEAEAKVRLARMDGLDAERAARRSERVRLVDGVFPQETAEARAEVERARVELDRADLEAKAAARLGEQGVIGRIQVDRAELDRRLASMGLDRAVQAVSILEAEHRARVDLLSAEERRLEGDLAAERAAREAILASIESSRIRAPVPGTVVADRLAELPGRAVRRGDEILRLGTDKPLRFEGLLSDAGRASTKKGQRARIRLDGYPWLVHGTLEGRVENVSDRRGDEGGFRVEVEVAPSGGPGPLREGMRGVARIAIEERVRLGRLLLERLTERTRP
jgi:membrane fusion protein (multidrug efflux system)